VAWQQGTSPRASRRESRSKRDTMASCYLHQPCRQAICISAHRIPRVVGEPSALGSRSVRLPSVLRWEIRLPMLDSGYERGPLRVVEDKFRTVRVA
jgi:hypothetical protein